MEEINILEFWQYLKKRWSYFLVFLLFLFVSGILFTIIIKTPMYQSTTSLTLSGVDKGDTKLTTNDVTFNTKMVPTYQEVLKSRRVLEQVIDNLNIDKSISELASNITLKSVTDSIVLKITVIDSDRILSKDIANELAVVFSSEIQNMYNIKNVIILDKAIVSEVPYNINYIKSFVMSLVLGIFGAFIILFVLYYFDNTIKSVEQVEDKFDLIVLGGVPNCNVGKTNGRKKRK